MSTPSSTRSSVAKMRYAVPETEVSRWIGTVGDKEQVKQLNEWNLHAFNTFKAMASTYSSPRDLHHKLENCPLKQVLIEKLGKQLVGYWDSPRHERDSTVIILDQNIDQAQQETQLENSKRLRKLKKEIYQLTEQRYRMQIYQAVDRSLIALFLITIGILVWVGVWVAPTGGISIYLACISSMSALAMIGVEACTCICGHCKWPDETLRHRVRSVGYLICGYALVLTTYLSTQIKPHSVSHEIAGVCYGVCVIVIFADILIWSRIVIRRKKMLDTILPRLISYAHEELVETNDNIDDFEEEQVHRISASKLSVASNSSRPRMAAAGDALSEAEGARPTTAHIE